MSIKLVDSAKLDAALKSTADAIRAKTGGTGKIPWSETEGFKSAVEGITAGSAMLPGIVCSMKEGSDALFKAKADLSIGISITSESYVE